MSQETSGVDSIFCAALEIEATEQRAAYVDEACGDDPQLKGRVQKLLDAHFRAGTFLESPASGLDATGKLPEISERPGTIIGRYKLMERIGEGGMGVVYVAEQREPVRRKVALKIIKPGMDTKEVIARFEAERQALALMDHPNIAKVLDAGATESGRPYFVMELVRGIPITDYCDQNNLTARERLELFLAVCQAVQHAHQKGVIHRDVKPTNVMITLHDGRPVPKIIDFGVAKAINQQLTERTVYTRYAQMIGTPLYMSPEQAELSGLGVDTRTDIYALGVLLYELLTGTTPFDKERLREAAYDEVRRIIREEEPPKPSTRISTLGEPATAISAHRKTDPKRLSQLVRGDLDWIVMKALEKDRTRRYETASGFAADVQRHLKDEPVEARAPSTVYRLRKFIRRNKVAVTTTALVALTLILGGAGTIGWVLERKSNRLIRLNEQAQVAIERGALGKAEDIIDELRGLEFGAHRATLRTVRQLALAYAQPEVDRVEDAVRLLQKTLEVQRLVLGEEDGDTLRTAESLKSLAKVCDDRAWELTQSAGARKRDYDRGLALAHLTMELDPSWPYAWMQLGLAQYRCGDWEKSLSSFQKSLELDETWVGPWLLMAMVHHQLGHEDLARDWYVAAGGWFKWWAPSKKPFLRLRDEAASLLGVPPEYLPADPWAERYADAYSRLIDKHPRVHKLMFLQGECYAHREDWKAAAYYLARAAELHPNLYRYRAWGAFCLETGDLEGYETACRRALKNLRNEANHVELAELLVLCCLGPSRDIDFGELDRIADDVLSTGPQFYVAYYRLGKAMVAYRSNRFPEAVEMLPEKGFTKARRRIDEVLARLFRAMTEHQLAHPVRARELLDLARREMGELWGPGRPRRVHTEGLIPWCMLHCALREAEALIEPAEKQSESGSDGVEKGNPETAASGTR